MAVVSRKGKLATISEGGRGRGFPFSGEGGNQYLRELHAKRAVLHMRRGVVLGVVFCDLEPKGKTRPKYSLSRGFKRPSPEPPHSYPSEPMCLPNIIKTVLQVLSGTPNPTSDISLQVRAKPS